MENIRFCLTCTKNATLHGILEKWDCSSNLWRKKFPAQAKGTAISHETHKKCNSSRNPWRIQFFMSPVEKATLDEILPCRKQFCVKPTQKIMKSTKNAILHKFRDTCCSSWNPVRIQLFTKHTKSEFFMKSMKNPIPHESPKQCNSSWNPWRIQFFMKSFRKETFRETSGEWNSASNYGKCDFSWNPWRRIFSPKSFRKAFLQEAGKNAILHEIHARCDSSWLNGKT